MNKKFLRSVGVIGLASTALFATPALAGKGVIKTTSNQQTGSVGIAFLPQHTTQTVHLEEEIPAELGSASFSLDGQAVDGILGMYVHRKMPGIADAVGADLPTEVVIQVQQGSTAEGIIKEWDSTSPALTNQVTAGLSVANASVLHTAQVDYGILGVNAQISDCGLVSLAQGTALLECSTPVQPVQGATDAAPALVQMQLDTGAVSIAVKGAGVPENTL